MSKKDMRPHMSTFRIKVEEAKQKRGEDARILGARKPRHTGIEIVTYEKPICPHTDNTYDPTTGKWTCWECKLVHDNRR